MAGPTPREAMAKSIAEFEGLFQARPDDPGNYVRMPDGSKRLVGTMRGVTASAAAQHVGFPEWQVTAEWLRRSVTADFAASVAEGSFYRALRIDRLPWGPATEVVLDFAWGSWTWAIVVMQRLCGTKADGKIGMLTVEAYSRWVAKIGWEEAVKQLHAARMAYYKGLAVQDPYHYEWPQAGWKRRADWFLPTNARWWGDWKANLPAVAVTDNTEPLKPSAPVMAAGVPKPITQSKTAQSIVVAGAGGVVAAANEAGLGDILQAAIPQVTSTASLAGIAKWVALGLVLGGVAFAAYRLWDDRRKSWTAS